MTIKSVACDHVLFNTKETDMFAIEGADGITCVRFSSPMLCISNAILGGGLRQEVYAVINYTLQKYERPEARDMPEFCRLVAIGCGCDPEASIVMLTAVSQRFKGVSRDGCCIVTAGLGNAVALPSSVEWDERSGDYAYNPGTINCIVVVPDTLSPAALVEAYGIAKLSTGEIVKAWSEHRPSSQSLVGTPTDCLTVVCPADRPTPLRFAGLGTKIGNQIARSVAEALGKALSHKYPDTLTLLTLFARL